MKQFLLLNFFCSFYMFFFINSAFAQSDSLDDPFNLTEPLSVESNKVFLLWMENAPFSTAKCYQKVYGLKLGQTFLDPDSLISITPKQEDSRIGGGPWTDAVSGKFDVSPYDQVVSIWGGGKFPN